MKVKVNDCLVIILVLLLFVWFVSSWGEVVSRSAGLGIPPAYSGMNMFVLFVRLCNLFKG
jgi:hypothetical protein